MKNILCSIFIGCLLFACKENTKDTTPKQGDALVETLAVKEEMQWEVLFDGTSFEGWKEYGKDSITANWKLENGAMVFYPPEERPEGTSYNLVTTREYTDFVLSLEWKISEGGNSGIFWGIKEIATLGQPYESGPEIQVLDNTAHPDAKNGTTHQAGALYDMVAPSKDMTKAVGSWNTCVITINHKENKGSVVLNNENIVVFPLDNSEWEEMVSNSKFATWEHFGKYTTGKIGLQDHGDIVSYRNIKIKEL